MTYTILPTTGRAKAQKVPMMRNGNYDYSFLKSMKQGQVAAIRVTDRSAENVRRAVQITTDHKRNTSVLDTVLMVW